MHPVLKKLNLKDENKLLILKAPDIFEPILSSLREDVEIIRSVDNGIYKFVICFVLSAQEIKESCQKIDGKIGEDVKLWFAYPKKSSKKYTTDIGRDHGWQPVGDMGYEGVRMVAINEDWSALRFRQVDFIKKLKRDQSRIMSKKGKGRSTDQ